MVTALEHRILEAEREVKRAEAKELAAEAAKEECIDGWEHANRMLVDVSDLSEAKVAQLEKRARQWEQMANETTVNAAEAESDVLRAQLAESEAERELLTLLLEDCWQRLDASEARLDTAHAIADKFAQQACASRAGWKEALAQHAEYMY